MSYFVFMDNSDTTVWRIDFGKLLKFVTSGRVSDIKSAVLFGSKPSHNDTFWGTISKIQLEIVSLDRNTKGKRNTSIVSKIDRAVYKHSTVGDIFVLVVGDNDFMPALETIRAEKCKSIVAFWDNASGELISEADDYMNLTQNINSISY